MKTRWRGIVLVATTVIAWQMRPLAQASRADVALRAAIETETVKGDLKAAIAQYQKLAESSDRATAAKALMRLAECYQKLGDADAQKVYERVVREFSDQREQAALARTRLAGEARGSTATGMTMRRVWDGTGVDDEGMVSPDGRYVSFPAWSTGDQAVRDLTTGTSYLITKHEGGDAAYTEYAEESSISPDSTQVAYSWFNGTDRYELRLLPLRPTSPLAPPRRLYDNPDVQWIAPYEWSPDGQFISVQTQRKDHTGQIGLISVADGSLRVLKSIDWRGTSRIAFSRDGKFLAFDLPGNDSSNDDRQVYLIAVDGSRETRVPSPPGENLVVGFTPDGTRLLVGSDRSGSYGLWAIPIENGKIAGSPDLLKPDIPSYSVGLTKTGQLFMVGRAADVTVNVATADLNKGELVSPPVAVASKFVAPAATPMWSPDGKQLVYLSVTYVGQRRRLLVVRSTETGSTKDLPVELDYFGPPSWTPDGRSLVVKGRDFKGRGGIFMLDVEGRQMKLLRPIQNTANGQTQISPDGRKIYFWDGEVAPNAPGSRYVEHDLVSGQERTVFSTGAPWWPMLSPDGRFLAGVEHDDRTKASALAVVEVSTGARRELMRAAAPQSVGERVSWTPDSRSLILRKNVREETEYFVVPVFGGTPHPLNLAVPHVRGEISVHPDGQRIAFTAGQPSAEMWVLENFLPATHALR